MSDTTVGEKYRIIEQVKFWRHKKTNNIYRVLGISICSTNADNGKLSVVYVNSSMVDLSL